MYVIVNLYGNANRITTADTKAAGESDLVLQPVICDRFVHQFHDTVRAFDMTSTSDAYLNNHRMTIPFCLVRSPAFMLTPDLKIIRFSELYLCHYLIFEEFFYICGGNGVEIVVEGNAYALLTFTHAKSTAEGNFIGNIVFVDQALELFYNLTGTLDVAGTADANC